MRRAGLQITVDGSRRKIRGPRRAETIALKLLAHKPAVMAAIEYDAAIDLDILTPADLPADWHFLWDERAAFMEYDGGLTKEHAEAAALADILKLMRQRGLLPLDKRR